MKRQGKFLLVTLLIILVLGLLTSCKKDNSKDFVYTFINEKEISITDYKGNDSHIIVPEYIDDYLVTSIATAAFWGKVDARSITLPDSIVSIGDNAFYSCASLTSFYIPKNLEELGNNVFTACPSLETISGSEDGEYFIVEDGILYNKDKTKLVLCPPMKKITDLKMPITVEYIERNAFNGNSFITNIEFSPALLEVGTTAFKECSSLKEAILPEGVESVRPSAFWSCSSLETVKLPESITYIGEEIFYDCSKLREVIVKEGSYAHEWYVKNGRSKDISFY